MIAISKNGVTASRHSCQCGRMATCIVEEQTGELVHGFCEAHFGSWLTSITEIDLIRYCYGFRHHSEDLVARMDAAIDFLLLAQSEAADGQQG